MYSRAHGTHAHYNRVVVKASFLTVHVTDPTAVALDTRIHTRCCHLCFQFFRFSRRSSNIKPHSSWCPYILQAAIRNSFIQLLTVSVH